MRRWEQLHFDVHLVLDEARSAKGVLRGRDKIPAGKAGLSGTDLVASKLEQASRLSVTTAWKLRGRSS